MLTTAEKPVTIAAAAAELGVSRKTVLRYITRGALPSVKLEGRTGAHLIRRCDLDRLIAERNAA